MADYERAFEAPALHKLPARLLGLAEVDGRSNADLLAARWEGEVRARGTCFSPGQPAEGKVTWPPRSTQGMQNTIWRPIPLRRDLVHPPARSVSSPRSLYADYAFHWAWSMTSGIRPLNQKS